MQRPAPGLDSRPAPFRRLPACGLPLLLAVTLLATATPASPKPGDDEDDRPPKTAACNRPKSDGDPCDDGNPCTQVDTCLGGLCVGGNPTSCPSADPCLLNGVCDPKSGQCVNPPRPNGTPCDDGSACTRTDTCQAGVCTGGNPVVCTPRSQCHEAGTCNPTTGRCSEPPKQDGSACSDGNACTLGDTCQAGACRAGTPKPCPPPNQCHLEGTCDPTTGSCIPRPKPDGERCDDGDRCTLNDTCRAGTCRAGTPKTCVALDQCHLPGTCLPATGECTNPPKPDGTACDDGSACTRRDTCRAGACAGADPVVCTARSQCHQAGTCDPASGRCSDPERPTGTPCDDGNPCTLDDACAAGACRPGSPKPCPALDQCHADGRCDPATGLCTTPRRPDGTPCNDSDLCTVDDRCRAGLCTGEVLDCEDGFSCTDDRCRDGMCEHLPRHERCTSGDSCGGAICRPEDSLADFETGCTIRRARPDGETCEEDFDPCTDDRCLRGACVHEEVRNRTACAAVLLPYRRALELGREAAAFDATLIAWVPDGDVIGARAQLAGNLRGFTDETALVAEILSGRRPVDGDASALAVARARAALPVATNLTRRGRAMVALVRRSRQAGEMPRESSQRVLRELRALVARSRALQRSLRQIVNVSRLFARG